MDFVKKYFKTILVIAFLFVSVGVFNMNVPTVQAATAAELQALIAQLQAQIADLQKQLAGITGEPAVWCHDFNRNLKFGNGGEEVRALQTALQKQDFYKGTITGNFEQYTASAVVGFQEKYKETVLAPWGLAHGTGFVGSTTREKLNELYGCGAISLPVESYIKVLSPDGGEEWVKGSAYDIKWDYAGFNKPKVDLYKQGSWYKPIAFFLTETKQYLWTVPDNVEAGNEYKIRVSDYYDSTTFDESDDYFSIVDGGVGLFDVENQLASLVNITLQIAERLKELMKR